MGSVLGRMWPDKLTSSSSIKRLLEVSLRAHQLPFRQFRLDHVRTRLQISAQGQKLRQHARTDPLRHRAQGSDDVLVGVPPPPYRDGQERGHVRLVKFDDGLDDLGVLLGRERVEDQRPPLVVVHAVPDSPERAYADLDLPH